MINYLYFIVKTPFLSQIIILSSSARSLFILISSAPSARSLAEARGRLHYRDNGAEARGIKIRIAEARVIIWGGYIALLFYFFINFNKVKNFFA
jgi:hypothetical protein